VNSRAILVSCLLAVPAQCQRIAIKTYTTADGCRITAFIGFSGTLAALSGSPLPRACPRFDGYGFTTYGQRRASQSARLFHSGDPRRRFVDRDRWRTLPLRRGGLTSLQARSSVRIR